MMNTIKYVAFATKFYSKVFIQLEKSKLTASQFRFSVQTHQLIARGYVASNIPNICSVIEKYNEEYEEKLKKLLEDPKYKAMYDKYKLEIEFINTLTGKVPEKLRAYDWLHLLKTTARGQRRAYLEYRWRVDRKIETRKAKDELRKASKQERNIIIDENQYALGKNTMFYRIGYRQMFRLYNARLISAMLHEPTIVFDLGYEEYMDPNEQLNCAKQLLLSFSNNRQHDNPFNLYFCNAERDSVIMQRMHRIIPTLYDIDFPLNITSKSYLELFDKKKLVYLTPHTNNIMTKYNPNKIYIIGAMVDKSNPKPISFIKANQENIEMMKFPLSETLDWGMGSKKNLPLNQVLSILLDFRKTNDWKKAFDATVPKRKLKPARAYNMQKLQKLRVAKQILNDIFN